MTSSDVRDGAIRSIDIRDGSGVKGRDVASDALGPRQIDEATLDAGQFTKLAGFSDAVDCDPASSAFTPCLATKLDLPRSSRLFVVATGSQYTSVGDADGSEASCQLRVDGGDRGISVSPGETGASSHRGESANGFARTLITPDPLPAGTHEVALSCAEFRADVRIGTPTLAVLAISAG